MNSTFIRYVLVGLINTVIHWSILGCCFYLLGINQAASNLAGFCAAVTFSFFVNAKWTFESETSLFRYFIFVGFMGLLAYLFGWAADHFVLPPIITAVAFSAFSLLSGYFYSKHIVFTERKTTIS
ncbi:GtrA family protein [Pantoea sp. BAV 3049]|uniref:GtrA family protein n=1 Tax=Pantoea sp. BAV 3049 TaxID=2654188 RepID=UPI00131BBAC4|nr:GtrA family protein [Pantoea sp. BAV 3049]